MSPLRSTKSDANSRFALSDLRFLLGISGLAVALRLGYGLRQTPYDWPDSLVYLDAGLSLLRHGRIVSDLATSHFVMPLYPLMLAVLGWDGITYWQAALSACLALVAYRLAYEVFDSRAAARWAAALVALEPLGIFYANQRLTETPFTFVLLLALLALYRGRYGWGSVLLVLSILMRPTLDLLAPLLIAVAGMVNDGRLSLRRTMRRLAIYAVVYATLMAPWWWHNYERYGRFIRLNLGDGVALHVENNPIFVAHGFDWDRLRPVLQEFDGIADPVRRNALHREAAYAFIREDPLRYLVMSLHRLGRFWSPVANHGEPFPFAPKLGVLVFAMTPLLLIAAALCVARAKLGQLARMLPLILVVAYLTTIHALVHAVVRYRVPLMPIVAVLAAGAIGPVSLRIPDRSQAAGPAGGQRSC